MFLVEKVISSRIKDIADDQIITHYYPCINPSITVPERDYYKDIYECMNNLYIAEETISGKIVGLIAGKRDVLCTETEDMFDGYRITMLLFDEEYLSIYDKVSTYNMAKQLVRAFCVDKNAFNIFMEYNKYSIDTELNEYSVAGLSYNEFHTAQHSINKKTYYLRSPMLTRFKGYYN